MSGLEFERAELVKEVSSLKSIAAPFLDARTLFRLDVVLGQLRSAPRRATLSWRIPLDDPLLTQRSEGEYEQQGRHGSHAVVGALAFLWQLELEGDIVRLVGNATTKIKLSDCHHEPEDARHHLGVWRMEIGADDSPGACFHVQVVGDEQRPPFPPSLPVPRFPTLVPTPMAALEFLLGELFQDRWKQAVGAGGGAGNLWRTIQRRRWNALLEWQWHQITDGNPSPWIALKRFPPVDTFVKG